MKKKMKKALVSYGKAVKRGKEWKAAKILNAFRHKKDFEKWAMAVRIYLRAEELLNASDQSQP